MLEISRASLSVNTGTALDLCIVATPFIFAPVYVFPSTDFVQGMNPVSKDAYFGVSRPGGILGDGKGLEIFLGTAIIRLPEILLSDLTQSSFFSC